MGGGFEAARLEARVLYIYFANDDATLTTHLPQFQSQTNASISATICTSTTFSLKALYLSLYTSLCGIPLFDHIVDSFEAPL